MSDVLENENGRIGEIDAPAGAREKNAGFDVGNRNDAEAKASETPSLPNASMLAAHGAAGHEFIPLHGASDIGKDGKRIGKQPLYNAWPTKAAMTLEAAVSHMQAGWNIGVRLREVDLVIDVDPRHFDVGDDPVARLWKDFALPECPFVRTGGGGFHFYLRKPSEIEVVDRLDAYKGIEFKSKGRQVVAAGSVHPDTGRLYAFDDDPIALLLSEAPEATTVLVDAIRRPISAASSGEPGEITPEQLAELLTGLDILGYNDRYDDWLKIMMSAHFGTNGEGLDEFVAWSLGDPDYADDEAVIRDKWNRLAAKPNGVKLGTLLKALADDGHGAFIEEVLRSPAEEDFPDTPEMPLSPADIALAEVNRGHFTVLHGGKYLVGRERRHPTLGHTEVEWFSDHAVKSHEPHLRRSDRRNAIFVEAADAASARAAAEALVGASPGALADFAVWTRPRPTAARQARPLRRSRRWRSWSPNTSSTRMRSGGRRGHRRRSARQGPDRVHRGRHGLPRRAVDAASASWPSG